jgi:hypothetical protein
LKNKYVELRDLLYDSDIDVCAISETWLDETVQDAEFTPDDYVCFRKDRKLHFYHEGCYKQEHHGGVLLLVKANLNPTPYHQGDVDAEISWVKIHSIKPKNFRFGRCCV